jgi:ribosomal protein S18 acetylase RimI-like enzyme
MEETFCLKKLEKSEYEGYQLKYNYTTESHYQVTVKNSGDTTIISFEKKFIGSIMNKSFESKLYEPYFLNAIAFGYFDNECLVAVIEMNHEDWNNRIRVTELLVLEPYRRRGYGHQLMAKVKEVATNFKVRAIILETQTCNTNAIEFYKKEGFQLVGFDSISYSNIDVEKKEVRIELGLLLS